MATEPQDGGLTVDYVSAGSFVPPSPDELAARLPNLEVTELLGHGGMGVVYKGRQPFLDRDVAIKLIRPDFDNDGSRRKFLQEARALAKLTHPYIVTVFDCGQVGDLIYLVMEYVAGSSLRSLIAEKSISDRDVLDLLPQIGAALQHSHESGIVHRDVKPENILVDRRNRVRLVDFGLARWVGPTAQQGPDEGRVAGTWGYMAPEQLSAPDRVDHRADIFSTGVVCYEMLTGTLPVGEPDPPSAKAGTDPHFDPIVKRALERDRERRYQQMRDMNADVIRLTRTPASSLRITQTVSAPVENVFAAWTEPGSMTDWYAPTDDFRTQVDALDLRVGGSYRVGMKPPDRPDVLFVNGQYCRIEPPNLLVFTWLWENQNPGAPDTQVTVEFRPNGTATDVTLIHERFRDEKIRDGHAEGWAGCLNRLARKLGGA